MWFCHYFGLNMWKKCKTTLKRRWKVWNFAQLDPHAPNENDWRLFRRNFNGIFMQKSASVIRKDYRTAQICYFSFISWRSFDNSCEKISLLFFHRVYQSINEPLKKVYFGPLPSCQTFDGKPFSAISWQENFSPSLQITILSYTFDVIDMRWWVSLQFPFRHWLPNYLNY